MATIYAATGVVVVGLISIAIYQTYKKQACCAKHKAEQDSDTAPSINVNVLNKAGVYEEVSLNQGECSSDINQDSTPSVGPNGQDTTHAMEEMHQITQLSQSLPMLEEATCQVPCANHEEHVEASEQLGEGDQSSESDTPPEPLLRTSYDVAITPGVSIDDVASFESDNDSSESDTPPEPVVSPSGRGARVNDENGFTDDEIDAPVNCDNWIDERSSSTVVITGVSVPHNNSDCKYSNWM